MTELPRLSIAEPVSELRKVRIRDNGEPLVDFLELCPDLQMDRPRFTYRRETVLRKTVAEKLCAANAALMSKGFRILVVEGWRAPHIQRRMYAAVWKQFATRYPEKSHAALTRLVNQFTAPMNQRVPPPHSTGAAIDVTLTDLEGNPLDVRSPYVEFDPAGFHFAAPNLTPEARQNRATLAEAMVGAGITNYPSEYWHWSYGDQGWAYRGRYEHAIYKAIEPTDWRAHPDDLGEHPLEFIGRDTEA